ncbi:serine/arginine repetitive matrix protein 1-like [Ischnura elegans]|uniref:serine/arginine repetitive matrix protein 1-like n=1 Tax=Ischnura elegans TaxID=197161 RepID=UPI001ED87594|nr:serine/arginine repetitive matrix protein 1-like [Ischnura elegans]XP_046404334.1 serine/arginine repetitive matrix protein 1-like [Ischnura elegans]
MCRELACPVPLVPYPPSTPPSPRDEYSVISDAPLPEDRRGGASWEHFRVSSEERRRRNRKKRRNRRRRYAERRRDAAGEDARPPAASPLTPPPISQPRPRPQVTARPQSPPRVCVSAQDEHVRFAAAPTPLLSAEEIAQLRLLSRGAPRIYDARRGGEWERHNPPRLQQVWTQVNVSGSAKRRKRRRRRGGNSATPSPEVLQNVPHPRASSPVQHPAPAFQPEPPPPPPAMPRMAWPSLRQGRVSGGASNDFGHRSIQGRRRQGGSRWPQCPFPLHPSAAPTYPAPQCRAMDDPAPPASQYRAFSFERPSLFPYPGTHWLASGPSTEYKDSPGTRKDRTEEGGQGIGSQRAKPRVVTFSNYGGGESTSSPLRRTRAFCDSVHHSRFRHHRGRMPRQPRLARNAARQNEAARQQSQPGCSSPTPPPGTAPAARPPTQSPSYEDYYTWETEPAPGRSSARCRRRRRSMSCDLSTYRSPRTLQ